MQQHYSRGGRKDLAINSELGNSYFISIKGDMRPTLVSPDVAFISLQAANMIGARSERPVVAGRYEDCTGTEAEDLGDMIRWYEQIPEDVEPLYQRLCVQGRFMRGFVMENDWPEESQHLLVSFWMKREAERMFDSRINFPALDTN